MKVTLDNEEAPTCVTIETADETFYITASTVERGIYVSHEEPMVIVPVASCRFLIYPKVAQK